MKAVITANDESGNIFKKIYLQDETGASKWKWTRTACIITIP